MKIFNLFRRKKYKTVKDFLEDESIVNLITRIDDLDGKIYSDVTDGEGNQYIDIVQEGGGVLGIGLVGFTYALEYAGIRFWRLAGTSAGAINTMLLATVKDKSDLKSDYILDLLLKTNLFDFVDGHWIVRLGVKNIGLIYLFVKLVLLTPIVAFFLTAIYLLDSIYSDVLVDGIAYVILSLMALTVLSIVFVFILFRKFKNSDYGLCNGWEFQSWMRKLLEKNNAESIREFNKKTVISAKDQGLKCKSKRFKIPDSKISLISCDITDENKIEFPRDMHRYGYAKTIRPSHLVRASMSIPFFFKPAVIRWTEDYDKMRQSTPDKINHFVDGGMLSNFPMDVFHNSNSRSINMPIVGVNLNNNNKSKRYILGSLFSFMRSMLNTMRFYNDKNFLDSNKFYQKYCIHNVDTAGFNWLNFNMSNINKFQLFKRGVESGVKFLESFDWNDYKKAHKLYFSQTEEIENAKMRDYRDIQVESST